MTRNSIQLKIFLCLPLIGFISACSTHPPAPVIDLKHSLNTLPDYSQIERGSYNGSYYEVQKGDTLYFIAYVTNRDVKEIIEANKLPPPHTIHPGQKLKLWGEKYIPPEYGQKSTIAAIDAPETDDSSKVLTLSVTAPPVAAVTIAPPVVKKPKTELNTIKPKENSKTVTQKKPKPETQAIKLVEEQKPKEYSQTVTKNKPAINKPKAESKKPLSWQWPTDGRVINGFSSSDSGNKGLDIAGSLGQTVTASADGKIVYAGNALRGYGNLIIIKHNDDYLSAYAHNDQLFVSERQDVKKGQKIAAMGSSGTNSVRLHFEIRYRGKSVNPLRYLPRR